ncbi:N-acyl homoserine lactonase family protein [Brevibacterium sp. RIT 803]|uniref:N-acyl homoserine lactonase family protein n=1 Tax=Brevibacterium sp. RIT 803 TaxID=2810210 RepID=UPI00194EF266|nr:N-acyl homoserine lactonase family protein [Brevibacterium sp. RIT 803]MBM6588934.1 N-acyl homoserine lactonase family protein [Brevibacterium sp. RIT 803]
MRKADDGVYALRYATRESSVRGEHFYGHPEDCMGPWPIHYYIWAILDGDTTVVVDTGFTREEATRRGKRHYGESPIELLDVLGVDPSDVEHVVLSHLHYDHTGFVGAFDSARVHVQRAELEFWRSGMACRGAYEHLLNRNDLDTIGRLEAEGRLNVIEGDWTIEPGISLHLVGGHTSGTQVVRVSTSDGPVLLASDASHFYANIEEDKPYGVVHELPLMYTAFDRLNELAGSQGVVVPGHDPRVAERHQPLPHYDEAIIRLLPASLEEKK